MSIVLRRLAAALLFLALLIPSRAAACYKHRGFDPFGPAPSSLLVLKDGAALARAGAEWLAFSAPAQEAWDDLDLMVLTGRFPEYPDRYYDMRIDYGEEQLAGNPSRLDLYDDIAVAHDILGNSNAALYLMERKAKQMEALKPGDPELGEHRLRFLANKATFLIHRWLRRGGSDLDLRDLQEARVLLQEAVSLEPGDADPRTGMQLRAVEWLIDPPVLSAEPRNLPDVLGIAPNSGVPLVGQNLQRDVPEGAREGLAGMIIWGAARHSVDFYSALSRWYEIENKPVAAAMARFRAQELAREGHRSAVPGAPTGRALAEIVGSSPTRDDVDIFRTFERRYQTLRYQSEQWQKHRLAFINARLAAGRHPDWDATFWLGYQEADVAFLSIPLGVRVWREFGVLVPLAALAFVLVMGDLLRRSRRPRPQMMHPAHPLRHLVQ